MAACVGEEQRRLRWQCRRGLLELDLLFSRCLADDYPGLEPADRAAFEELLKHPDQTLLAWFQGRLEPPQKLKNVIRNMSQHDVFKHK